MSIDSWGPKIWSILHITSFAYPEQPTDHDKQTMYNFYHSLKYLLPCPRCKTHFIQNLEYYMSDRECTTLRSQKNLSSYVVDLHNDVNERNGKERWEYERAEAHYCADKSGVCSIHPPDNITPAHTAPPESATQVGDWPRRCLGGAVILAVVLVLAILSGRYQQLHEKRDKTTTRRRDATTRVR